MNRLREYQRGMLATGGESISSVITLLGTDSMCSWALDGLGNWRRTTRTPVGGAETTEVRQHNKLHQITKAGSAELSYDTTGNMTDDGTRTFEYDAFNRIKTVTKKSGSVLLATYAYDAFGCRVSKTVYANL